MSTEPFAMRAAVTEAEKRAGRRQTRLLVVALIALTIISAFSVAGFFLAYSQAVANGRKAKQAVDLQKQVVALQEDQAKNAANGRAILRQLFDFTDPNGQFVKDQQTKVAGYLAALDAANRLGRADQLRKLGELFAAQGVPQSVIRKVLAEPVPMVTFGTSARPAPTGAASKPAPTPVVMSPTSTSVPCKILLGILPCVNVGIGNP